MVRLLARGYDYVLESLGWAVDSVGWWCVGLSVQIVGGVLPWTVRRDDPGQQTIVEELRY